MEVTHDITFPELKLNTLASARSRMAGVMLYSVPFRVQGFLWRLVVLPFVPVESGQHGCTRVALELAEPERTATAARITISFPYFTSPPPTTFINVTISSASATPADAWTRTPDVEISRLALLQSDTMCAAGSANAVLTVTVTMQAALKAAAADVTAWAAPDGFTLCAQLRTLCQTILAPSK